MANNLNKQVHRITHKLVIKGKLKLASPLVMGKGEGEWIDKAIMRLPDGRPYIPASAFAGSLKTTMSNLGLLQTGSSKKNYEWLWGSEKVDNNITRDCLFQSHLVLYDLLPLNESKTNISRRDGIRINYENGIVEYGAKYDYEILEPGIEFPLTMEITERESFLQTDDDLKTIAASIIAALAHDSFRLGAFTSQGFGRFTVLPSDLKAYLFNFTNENAHKNEHADAWFDYVATGEEPKYQDIPLKDIKMPELNYPAFRVDAKFRLKSALMIGASGGKDSKADKTAIKSNNQFVIPGKSIRGAIRHRAMRILKIWEEQGVQIPSLTNDLTADLFGYVNQNRTNNNNAKRGLIRVEETIIKENDVLPKLQNRIRIDRFTGGVIDGALFNSEPIWTKEKEELEISFTIEHFKNTSDELKKNYKKLLLMLLKDLWTGDLAIGGEKSIGRGVLQGKSASIIENGKQIAAFEWSDDGNNPAALTWIKGSAEELNLIVV